MVVYILSYVVEYSHSKFLGVFNSFDAALAEARRDNEDNEQTELCKIWRNGYGDVYAPAKDSLYFYDISEKEVKGEIK